MLGQILRSGQIFRCGQIFRRGQTFRCGQIFRLHHAYFEPGENIRLEDCIRYTCTYFSKDALKLKPPSKLGLVIGQLRHYINDINLLTEIGRLVMIALD